MAFAAFVSVPSSLGDRLALNVELQRELQVGRLVLRKRHRVDAGVARGAIRALFALDRAQHAFEAQIADAVGLEELANFLDRVGGADQLRLARRVNAVET